MRVAVFSSCTVDEITLDGKTQVVEGGPGLYSSLMARNLRFDVRLHAAVADPSEGRSVLDRAGVEIVGGAAKTPTRFALDVREDRRELALLSSGGPVGYSGGGMDGADGAIVTPVYDEVSKEAFESIKSDAGFVFLDPQGFLRRAGAGGAVSLERTDVDTGGVSAIKVDDEELRAMTGGTDSGVLARAGIDHVLHTAGRRIRMVSGGREYRIALPNRKIGDTTGVGDIFSASFCCTMLKERDSLWAFCFACGAAHAALDTHATGIGKVPSRRSVETSAAYFYNTVEFDSA